MNKSELFKVVTWPEVQNLMTMEGFRENAHLINDDAGYEKYGDSAYMVNLGWLEGEVPF